MEIITIIIVIIVITVIIVMILIIVIILIIVMMSIKVYQMFKVNLGILLFNSKWKKSFVNVQ